MKKYRFTLRNVFIFTMMFCPLQSKAHAILCSQISVVSSKFPALILHEGSIDLAWKDEFKKIVAQEPRENVEQSTVIENAAWLIQSLAELAMPSPTNWGVGLIEFKASLIKFKQGVHNLIEKDLIKEQTSIRRQDDYFFNSQQALESLMKGLSSIEKVAASFASEEHQALYIRQRISSIISSFGENLDNIAYVDLGSKRKSRVMIAAHAILSAAAERWSTKNLGPKVSFSASSPKIDLLLEVNSLDPFVSLSAFDLIAQIYGLFKDPNQEAWHADLNAKRYTIKYLTKTRKPKVFQVLARSVQEAFTIASVVGSQRLVNHIHEELFSDMHVFDSNGVPIVLPPPEKIEFEVGYLLPAHKAFKTFDVQTTYIALDATVSVVEDRTKTGGKKFVPTRENIHFYMGPNRSRAKSK